ncbi:ferredoxin-type protein NapF [Marinobacter daqiaonensis]|uniref:Ferredoxin-type protein NapF n=1 Tax=Marinobacter daqiaonensis TaxID=650891 RepID=A0A1I6IM86_9GAMM|nr:ferredoxin-type protein NapF [Marinobacter daqiaonensis]SFR67390.1 ferredoxin-type protein NapF [Marinobacter daqiaonensis]
MTVSRSRRTLFLGGRSAVASERRPPWTSDSFTDLCSRCGDCIRACPEQVLAPGDGGFPQVVFRGEGCTFCGECAGACPEPVFDLAREAFHWKATVGNTCLALNGIHCQSCQDACEPRAIRFRPRLGKPPEPDISEDTCTGCFACAAVCPQDAISLNTPSETRETSHA